MLRMLWFALKPSADTVKRKQGISSNMKGKWFTECMMPNIPHMIWRWIIIRFADNVEMIHDYFDANTELFDENLVMCGDFNSSTAFDKKHPKNKNHTRLNEKLETNGLFSVYHSLTGEIQGEEKSMTFYQSRHLNYPFHLDFVYAGENIVKEFSILDHYRWITLSDHLPLVFKI